MKRWIAASGKGLGAALLSALCAFVIMQASGPVALASELELSLADAISRALRDNQELRIARSEAALAEAKREFQETALPSITLTARPVELRGDTVRQPRSDVELSYSPTDSLRLDLTVAVDPNATNGGRSAVKPVFRANYVQPLFEVKAREVDVPEPVRSTSLTSTETRLAVDVAKAYVALLKQRDLAEYRRAELEIAEAKLARARSLARPEIEILRAEDELDAARTQWQAAVAAAENAEQALAQLLNVSADALLTLSANIPYEPLASEDEGWLAAAMAASEQVANAQRALAEAEARLEQAQRDHGWDISLNGYFEWRTESAQGALLNPEARSSYGAWIHFRRSFFPGNPFVEDEAALAVEKAALTLENAVKRVESDVQNALRRIQEIEERMVSLEERLADADSALERERRRMEAGLATELDVEEVALAVNKLEIDQSHARFDHFIARMELAEIAGYDVLDL